MCIGALLFFAGCGSEEPSYTEVKQLAPEPEAGTSVAEEPAHTHTHARPTTNPGFAYSVPEGWTVQQASSMKLLSLAVGEPPEQISEMSVSAFPGDVGGKLANVNRWRRQVGLGPISPEALDGFISPKEISGMAAWEVDFTGPEGSAPNGASGRVVVRAVEHNGKTWFFKLAGSESALADEMEAFGQFLDSVAF